jgi:pyruvate/2-oxoglutarate dehydrogenase complex dihydrolipoamide acyltransferase (E2) component
LRVAAARKAKELGERRRERKAGKVNATPAAVAAAGELEVDIEAVDGTVQTGGSPWPTSARRQEDGSRGAGPGPCR